MEALKQNHNKIISAKQAKKLVILLVFTLCVNFIFFSVPALADVEAITVNISGEEIIVNSELIELADIIKQEPEIAIKSSGIHTITAYNSDPAQTDDTPCITANGFDVCEHGVEDTVAANFLPFGAKIRMPELYGDRVFIVRDRMNSRYASRVDIWMLEKADARNFGVQRILVEVLE